MTLESISKIFLVMMVIFTPDCKREDFSWGIKIGNITYSGNVIFLTPEELALIKEVNTGSIVFSEGTGGITRIADKSILVLGVSEKTPFGLLRKATGIEISGTDLIIKTTDVFLTEAVKEGTVKFQQKLLEKDFRLIEKADGVLVTGSGKSFDGLAVTLDNLKLHDNGETIASIGGAIGISPEIGITIKNVSNSISEITFTSVLNKIDEVTVNSAGGFNGAKEVVAASFIHIPVVIDSLVFVPEVRIICGFEGTVSGGVSSGVRQDRIISSQMKYIQSAWSANPLTQSTRFDFITPQITDNSDLRIYSGPEITIRLFGVPIQTIKATGFFSLEAEKNSTPFWKLLIGNNGYNTAKNGIFGLGDDYSASMEIEASEISNADDLRDSGE